MHFGMYTGLLRRFDSRNWRRPVIAPFVIAASSAAMTGGAVWQ